MELLIIKYWFLTFTGILLFLGGLTCWIQRQNSTEKSLLDQMNQQGHRNSRRKNTRNANKKKQQQQTTTTTNTNSNHNDIRTEEEEEEEQNTTLPEKTTENDEKETSRQQTDDEEHEQKINFQQTIQTEQHLPPSTHIEDQQEPTMSVKQRQKNKVINNPPSKEESFIPSKPQASVAPVKQAPSSPSIKDTNLKSPQNQYDNYPKSNGHSSSSYNLYTYSAYNPLPPRFQQQRQQQKEASYGGQRYRRRRGRGQTKRSSFPPDSAERFNDFIPSSYIEPEQQQMNNNQTELSANYTQQQQEVSIQNGYSSESDILTDSPSTGENNSQSPLLSTSAGSQSSLQRLDLVRSLASSHGLLDELISIFDTTSFSSDELELILNKIATKHILDKHDLPRLISSTKTDKTLERILEETFHSQAKILAIELQSEKNRVLDLTRSNADMENAIRQLQQQQQQQPNNMFQYQQMVLSYQVQLRRLADENARLQHQLHAYSMMPAALNELKQQQHILNEQIRQMEIKNNALENQAAESERASKHAAEIYKKADGQKQERIEKMIADINKYKKLDKELTSLRQKHTELEKNFNSKITEITDQRDELQSGYDQLKEQVQQYEQLQIKYDQLVQNPTNDIAQKINDLKTENDQLRQSNWKNMEELNKQQQNQTSSSS